MPLKDEENEKGLARLWRIQFKATVVSIILIAILYHSISMGCVASLAIMLLVASFPGPHAKHGSEPGDVWQNARMC